MLVKDIAYKFFMLDCFAVNELYRKCQREITEDFEKAYVELLNQELPDDSTEDAKENWANYKTGLLVAFVSGHLNFADPSAKFFAKFNDLLGPTEEVKKPSGLILPAYLRT
jgi:hypothetical protein